MRLRNIFGFVFFLLIQYGLFAACSNCGGQEFVSCEKTYIQEEQIHVYEKRIFVDLGDSVLHTSGIYSDERGYYFKDYKQGNCDSGEWQCQHCKTCNPIWNTLCKKCSRINWKGSD